MNKTSEQKFLEALDICQSLIDFKYRPTNLTYQAIELFCDIAKNPLELLELCQKYSGSIEKICEFIHEYGTSIDNWRVDCPLGFGVKDHCSFLIFFLNLDLCQFEYFTDNFTTLEQIAELFKDWKGIDFNSVIEKQKVVTFS
ncbi:hypothetical protein PN480_16015 [Dolichospermum circinale CS-1225]|uniref:hypothetical protein n=1 Tax=Dolichospermum circinale TaxID=109265 RepID=UPI0003F6ADEA|nr:hypothetical protein [Dolichospermum circinale]MDB9460609.1 hypothetical protein [Dolichospermum circinale CS-545/17]MDB9523439.1 hypothetical protein [Dolichospermum circinale CS-1225]